MAADVAPPTDPPNPALHQRFQIAPRLGALVLALEPRHACLRVPLPFAHSMRLRLEGLMEMEELDSLLGDAKAELGRPETWVTTFTVIPAFAPIP